MQHSKEQKQMGANQFSIKIFPNLPSIMEYHSYYLNCQYALELLKLCPESFKCFLTCYNIELLQYMEDELPFLALPNNVFLLTYSQQKQDHAQHNFIFPIL